MKLFNFSATTNGCLATAVGYIWQYPHRWSPTVTQLKGGINNIMTICSVAIDIHCFVLNFGSKTTLGGLCWGVSVIWGIPPYH